MPVISSFYGILVMMYYFDNKKHQAPHVHVRFHEFESVISIPDGVLLEGELAGNKLKLVQAWIEIHRDELLADWQLAVAGAQVFKIDPLK